MNNENRVYYFPVEVAEQLLCSFCKLYISCGPVKIAPNGNSICGRCSPLNCDKTYIQDVLFETSMRKFKFPCSYNTKGCTKLLLFGESIEHERICPFRSFSCPFLPYNDCIESVNGLDLYKHFEEKHKGLLIIDGEFVFDIEHDSQCNFLMKQGEVTFIVQYNYDAVKKILLLNIAHFSRNTQQKCRYRAQIVNGIDSDVAINCKEYACRAYDSPTLNEYNSDVFIISDYLKAINNPSSIIIKLGLTGNVENTATATSWDELEKYRCAHCDCISIPPIYKYQNAITCGDCKTKNGYSASYCTEVKTNETDFPCRWRECTFVGNKNNIREHVEKCEFRTYLCYIESCNTGYYIENDMLNHMFQHGTYCPDPQNIIIDFFKNSNDDFIHFTVVKNAVIVFRSYKDHINDRRNVHIKSFENNMKYEVKAYFEHNHCTLRSSTKTYKDNIVLDIFKQKLPPCFVTTKYIRGIFSITCQ